jgi:hypothetical protein
VIQLLEDWHTVGTKFERQLDASRIGINNRKAKPFEQGLQTLGKMLGCESKVWDDEGAPDGLWLLGNGKALVFEAKSDAEHIYPSDA